MDPSHFQAQCVAATGAARPEPSAEEVYAEHRRQSVRDAAEAEHLEWQIASAEFEIDALEAEIRSEEERAKRVQGYFQKVKRTLEEQRQRADQTVAIFAQLDAKQRQMHVIDEAGDLACIQRQAALVVTKEARNELTAQYAKGNEQLDEVIQMTATSEDQVEAMRAELLASQTSCAAIEQKVNHLRDTFEHTRQLMDERQTTIGELRARTAERTQRRDAERLRLTAQGHRHGQLAADWQQREAVLVEKRQQIEQMSQKATGLNQQFEAVLEELSAYGLHSGATLQRRRDELSAAGVHGVQYTAAEVASVALVADYLKKMQL